MFINSSKIGGRFLPECLG